MFKLYKMTAFSLIIMSLVVMFGGMVFANAKLTAIVGSEFARDISIGKMLFVNQCFGIANLILTFGNIALCYAIVSTLKVEEKKEEK